MMGHIWRKLRLNKESNHALHIILDVCKLKLDVISLLMGTLNCIHHVLLLLLKFFDSTELLLFIHVCKISVLSNS